MVAFGAIADKWNISVYIHIMDKNMTAVLIWNNSQKNWCVCLWGGGGGCWAFHFWITGSVLAFPVLHKNCHFFFITYNLPFEYHGIYYTNTISNQITNGIQDFVKCCIRSWVQFDLRPDNIIFGELQPMWHQICNSETQRNPAAATSGDTLFGIAARDLLYALPPHAWQHHGLHYTSCGALGEMRNNLIGQLRGINLILHTVWTVSYILLSSNTERCDVTACSEYAGLTKPDCDHRIKYLICHADCCFQIS